MNHFVEYFFPCVNSSLFFFFPFVFLRGTLRVSECSQSTTCRTEAASTASWTSAAAAGDLCLWKCVTTSTSPTERWVQWLWICRHSRTWLSPCSTERSNDCLPGSFFLSVKVKTLEFCVTVLLLENVSQVNSICWASVNYPDSHVLYPSWVLHCFIFIGLFVNSGAAQTLPLFFLDPADCQIVSGWSGRHPRLRQLTSCFPLQQLKPRLYYNPPQFSFTQDLQLLVILKGRSKYLAWF